MIKPIVKDEAFLAQASLPANKGDKKIGQDLLDTLAAHQEECVGMAANMIGVNKNVIVVHQDFMNLVMFNPVIVRKEGEYQTEEGCLSLKGVRKTKRYQEIEVEYYDFSFRKQRQTFIGFTAEIIQHECDHLMGILI